MQLPRFTKLFTLIIFILLSKLIFAQAAKTTGRVIKDSVTLAATPDATTGKFTIVLLPDTQFYTAEPQGTNGGTNTIFKRQIKWVINNRLQKNIVYVGQLGDCTEHGDEYEVEWKRSDTAMKLLENSNLTGLTEGIPYGICIGNHDQSPNGRVTGTTIFYNKYFGTPRFKTRSYYGGHFDTNNNNFYELFSVGNFDFLIICFEYDLTTKFTAPGGALDWAEKIIKSYPHRNVIVLSHYVLTATGAFSTQGYNIYKRLRIYPNFKFMSGGHVTEEGEAMRSDTYNGNTVYTVLSDYQGREKGGNGLLRIYEFDPANNDVAVKTYSPYTGANETDSNSQFHMKVSLTTNADHIALSTNNNKLSSKNNLSLKDNGQSFTIYPNPNSTNNLSLHFNNQMKGKLTLEIFNMAGNVLLQKTFRNISNTLTVDHKLPTGTYIVMLQTETGRKEKKITVIK